MHQEYNEGNARRMHKQYNEHLISTNNENMYIFMHYKWYV